MDFSWTNCWAYSADERMNGSQKSGKNNRQLHFHQMANEFMCYLVEQLHKQLNFFMKSKRDCLTTVEKQYFVP